MIVAFVAPVVAPLVALLVAQPTNEIRDAVEAHVELSDLRESFLAGDLVTLYRGLTILRERGIETRIGSYGLLRDLARLVRCLPLGPLPEAETGPLRAARLAARLERVRLNRLVKDGLYAATPLGELLPEPKLYQWTAADQHQELVRWPIEEERWPGEVVEGLPEIGKCPARPGALREGDPKSHDLNMKFRAAAERAAKTALLPILPDLPDHAAAKVALGYLVDALEAEDFRFPLEWADRLEAGLERGETSIRSAGLVMMARAREDNGDRARAVELYRALAADPTTNGDEDSRVRVRLAALEEPDWPRVLDAVRGVRNPRDLDEKALSYAEARALYAIHDFDALMTFGRVWLRKPRGGNEFDEAARDLLLRLAVELDPSQAMAWVEEIGEDAKLRDRLDELGRLSIESDNLKLATAIYDRLRLLAASERKKRGPAAAAEEAHWIAQRAMVEFVAEDAEAFAGFIDALIALATEQGDKPMARFAPHREIARLAQDLVGRLTNEVDAKPDRRKFAALLLEASVKLTEKQSRFQNVLEERIPPLRVLAGAYAAGRDRSVATPAARKTAKGARGKEKKIRQLGEVIVPRLPPLIEAPDFKTEVPLIDTYLVYEESHGALKAGAPWMELANLRKMSKTTSKIAK